MKLRQLRRSSSKSYIPAPKPMPVIGPMSGEISIAPMMTAAELVFKPSEATRTAITRIQSLAPRKSTPRSIFSITSCSLAASSPKRNKFFM